MGEKKYEYTPYPGGTTPIGYKIKKIRELRGLTQKELGLRCGYTPATADVRIAQYENGRKIPRDSTVQELAKALNVDPGILHNADLRTPNLMFHALLEISEYHGLMPAKIDGRYFLQFSDQLITGMTGDIVYTEYDYFLDRWHEKLKPCLYSDEEYGDNPPDYILENSKEYALWGIDYPSADDIEDAHMFNDWFEMKQLEEQLDITYAKMMKDRTLREVDEFMEEPLSQARQTYKDITKLSEIAFLLWEFLRTDGTFVISYTWRPAIPDPDMKFLMAFKVDELKSDATKQMIFAELLCQLETLQRQGFQIERTILSSEKNLYIAFLYNKAQKFLFVRLMAIMGDIYNIERERVFTPDWMRRGFDTFFPESFTGENDYTIEELAEDIRNKKK